ncbi:hypothetical protein GCM10009099_32910 [Caenispirillum bisanense]
MLVMGGILVLNLDPAPWQDAAARGRKGAGRQATAAPLPVYMVAAAPPPGGMAPPCDSVTDGDHAIVA